jgi:hypothetical protein
MRLAMWQAHLQKTHAKWELLQQQMSEQWQASKGIPTAAKEHAKHTKPRYSTCNPTFEQRPYAKNT